MFNFKSKGDYSKATKYLDKLKKNVRDIDLSKYGEAGVRALRSATPVDSGTTAASWYYLIENQNGKTTITFCNSNFNKGVPIAVILQYGHATRNGGWVQGRDYINPAIQPIFDSIAENAWKEVSSV